MALLDFSTARGDALVTTFLRRLAASLQDHDVPGHGAPCAKDYLDAQGDYIMEWKEYVKAVSTRA